MAAVGTRSVDLTGSCCSETRSRLTSVAGLALTSPALPGLAYLGSAYLGPTCLGFACSTMGRLDSSFGTVAPMALMSSGSSLCLATVVVAVACTTPGFGPFLGFGLGLERTGKAVGVPVLAYTTAAVATVATAIEYPARGSADRAGSAARSTQACSPAEFGAESTGLVAGRPATAMTAVAPVAVQSGTGQSSQTSETAVSRMAQLTAGR